MLYQFLYYYYIILKFCTVELAKLIKFSRPFLTLISKAKAAKLVRALVDQFLDMEAATGKEVGYTSTLDSGFTCILINCP